MSGRPGRLLACIVVALAGALPLSGPALAQGGTTTSAGDQQYVDPLTTASPAPATRAGTGTAAPAAPTGASPASSAPRAIHGSTQTLPYTGFNLWLLIAIGLGLLALGLVLRRLTRPRA